MIAKLALMAAAVGLCAALLMATRRDPVADKWYPPNVSLSERTEPDFDQCKDVVRGVMSMLAHDPEALRYAWPDEFVQGRYDDGVTIGEKAAFEMRVRINSKNSLGGYVGAKPYAFFFTKTHLVAVREPDEIKVTVMKPPVSITDALAVASKEAATSR